ncbi:uncharacterized protein N7515_000465 [Penicillium bovifimosum]|uniref:Glutathione S-transferase n=1 Tax=Penicillium bovifimosum TaxID=126998 RepID=A0A9W9LBG9_9EURO|nr:uncharacterized protein N7515_000465 [Penicillium bovifimosum]KAJ5145901.1 hypothetical protein N7515_000465 [Penicillium bovifimosum]
MSQITLYSWPTPNGIKASITLEELGLHYKTHAVDISTNVQKEDWFLKINPNGRIPAILDGDQRVFESGAIMLYLTDKYDPERKLSYAPGSPEYVEELSWLMFQMGGVGPMMGQAEHFRLFASKRSDYGIKRYIDETKRLYSVLDSRLKESPYLAGSKYTIADIANFSWVQIGPAALEIDLSEWPALEKWVEKIKEREAIKRGMFIPKTGTSPEQMAERFKASRARIDAMVNTDAH